MMLYKRWRSRPCRDFRSRAACDRDRDAGVMRWSSRPGHPDALVLRCAGRSVAWIEREGERWLARVRYAEVHLIAVFARRGDAQRFVERELWSEAGELAP